MSKYLLASLIVVPLLVLALVDPDRGSATAATVSAAAAVLAWRRRG